jgi:phage tail protein X
MQWEYTTMQGDTWDVLARDIYGSEKLAYVIQQANPEYLPLIFFPAGLVLTIPQTPPLATAQPRAPWADA